MPRAQHKITTPGMIDLDHSGVIVTIRRRSIEMIIYGGVCCTSTSIWFGQVQ